MKKLLFVLPIVVLLAASCTPPEQANNPSPVVKTPVDTTKPTAPQEPTLTPAPTPPFVTQTVTMQAAINIAVKDMGVDPADYEINASLKNNNWYISLAPKQPPCRLPDPCARISGGNANYVINAQTGVIISKQLGQ